jgi:mycothiol system anti-sigma-R factor
MECREVQSYLHAYLDGEFDEQERVAIATHLHCCGRCRALSSFERALRDKVRRSITDDAPAPAELRARIHDALARLEPQDRGRRAARALRWLIPATAAAMLIVGAVVPKRQEVRPASVLAESTIEWHRRNIPLDVTASSPETVKGFFSDKVPFAVRPPVFKVRQVQLVGGRLANLREHTAAYLVYRVDGRRVSVLVFDSTALPDVARKAHEQVHWHRLRGYSVAVFSSGGTGYAVASDIDTDRMVHLIGY